MKTNSITWFEIYVQDLDRAKKFYEAMLGIELNPIAGPDIPMLGFPQDADLNGSSGSIIKAEGMPSGGNSTLVYFECDDCSVEASRVNDAGGELIREKMSIGEFGFVAHAKDSEGNMIGLHSPT
jgi:uncharacterized protein